MIKCEETSIKVEPKAEPRRQQLFEPERGNLVVVKRDPVSAPKAQLTDLSAATLQLIAEKLLSTRSFGTLTSLNSTCRALRQSTTHVLWKMVMMDHQADDERVLKWLKLNEDKMRKYTEYLSIASSIRENINVKIKNKPLFPKLSMHVEPFPLVNLREGNAATTSRIRPWLLCIRKPVTVSVLHEFLALLFRSPSEHKPPLVNELVDVYFCMQGTIIPGAQVQKHRQRFSDEVWVQFTKVDGQAFPRSVAEAIELVTLRGPFHDGGFDPYSIRVEPVIPTIIFLGVGLTRLALFMERILIGMGSTDTQDFRARIELDPKSSATKIEKFFAEAISVTRALWIKLPPAKRRLLQGEECVSILEVHAITSTGELLVGSMTPSVRGDPATALVYDLCVAGESLRRYPRTETFDSRKGWVTSV